MSALNNGAMRKSENQDSLLDIGTGIAVARGYDAQVGMKIMQQEVVPVEESAVLVGVPSMEQLDAFIDNSSLAEEEKEATKANLHDKLLVELQKGGQADSRVVQQQLRDIANCLPDIRPDLRSFVENYAGVSPTIRLLSRGMLE